MSQQLPAASEVFDAETAGRLRTAIGRLSRQLQTTAAARQAGLSPTGVSILLTVARLGPITLSDLAAAEGINPTMLSRVVAALVEGGQLKRSSDSQDRRVAWVSETASGRRLAERVRRERTEALNGALGELPVRERRVIERALPALEALGTELQGARP